jgi:hypothetical protein
VKERPILFSAPMVRAILDGRKTQTRRALNPQPILAVMEHKAAAALKACRSHGLIPDGKQPHWQWRGCFSMPWPSAIAKRSRYGIAGDRLWVRETWSKTKSCNASDIFYRADGDRQYGRQHALSYVDREDRWRPSIHMPRWASRINLEVTGVRVEQLQDISEADAKAEGVTDCYNITDQATGEIDREAVDAYEELWGEINGAESWAANPWVWVVEFKRVTP